MLDAQVRRLDRSVDRLSPELRDLQSAQDGTEIKSRELELVTDRARNLGDRRDAFEKTRDAAAEAYRAETGDTWRPRYGSHASQTGRLTSAAIDARDFIRARKDRATMAHLPQGTLVAIAGGKDTVEVESAPAPAHIGSVSIEARGVTVRLDGDVSTARITLIASALRAIR